MKNRFKSLFFSLMISSLMMAGCSKEGPQGPQGPAGQSAPVYYSEWFSPAAWSGGAGDWYFSAGAPDLTEDVVEGGVVLAYAWLAGDVYGGSAVRPLPAYAVGANWSFLISEYGKIEFTCDMFTPPLTAGNKFRFIAIPGTIPALKSGTQEKVTLQELQRMPYEAVCRMFNIPE